MLFGDEIKESEINGACSIHVRHAKCTQKTGGKRQLGRPRNRWMMQHH
jgi:hypothetical protein